MKISKNMKQLFQSNNLLYQNEKKMKISSAVILDEKAIKPKSVLKITKKLKIAH